MTPMISVILPTLRPTLAKRCIERIIETSKRISYEVIVVTPIDNILFHPNVKFIKETEKNGTVFAIEVGIKHASGKYIFAMADDQLIETDCLKNLVEYMEKREDELLLVGPRYNNLWCNTPNQAIYGRYYPCNPCIKKENIEKVEGFFDTYYKHYYSDPDLTLRVLSMGGKVEVCNNAWIEAVNEVDVIEAEQRLTFMEEHENFINRWHKIYGINISSDPAIINTGIDDKTNDLNMEQCSRLISCIKNGNTAQILNDSYENICYNENNIPSLFGFILSQIPRISRLEKNLNFALQKYLIMFCIEKMMKGYSEPFDFRELSSKIDSTSISYRNLIIAAYVIFKINAIKNKSPHKLIFLKNYKGKNVIFEKEALYLQLKEIDENISNTPAIDYLELRLLENFILSNHENNEEALFSLIDYFCNQRIDNKRLSVSTGYLWWREKYD